MKLHAVDGDGPRVNLDRIVHQLDQIHFNQILIFCFENHSKRKPFIVVRKLIPSNNVNFIQTFNLLTQIQQIQIKRVQPQNHFHQILLFFQTRMMVFFQNLNQSLTTEEGLFNFELFANDGLRNNLYLGSFVSTFLQFHK